jgi:hypothetical protein
MLLVLQLALPAGGPPSAAGSLAARRPKLVNVPPVAEYPAILTAPVFAPDRKPGDARIAAAGGGGGGALDGYAALGAATSAGGAAAVVSGPGGAVKTLRRGETVEGWRLVALDASKLTFERNGQRRVLPIGAPAASVAGQANATPPDQPAEQGAAPE